MTYLHNFKREDGSEITVEYTFSGGSETTYSPRYGADGGDCAECCIVKAFNDEGDVALPTEECEKYEAWIIENVEHRYDGLDDF